MSQKSRFYVSVLIILTYLIFNTIPFCAFISSYEEYARYRESETQAVVAILLHLGFTADALIYIFIQRDVRKQLFELICCRICERKRNDDTLMIQDQRGHKGDGNNISSIQHWRIANCNPLCVWRISINFPGTCTLKLIILCHHTRRSSLSHLMHNH